MKKYISAILIPCLLLQLCGCYSIEKIADNHSSIEDIEKIILKTREGHYYEYDKFESSEQLTKETTKFFFTDYIFLDSNFTIVGKKFNATKSYKEKEIYITTDTLNYQLSEIESINGKQYNSTQTAWLVTGIIIGGLIIAVIIAMQNFHPLGSSNLFEGGL